MSLTSMRSRSRSCPTGENSATSPTCPSSHRAVLGAGSPARTCRSRRLMKPLPSRRCSMRLLRVPAGSRFSSVTSPLLVWVGKFPVSTFVSTTVCLFSCGAGCLLTNSLPRWIGTGCISAGRCFLTVSPARLKTARWIGRCAGSAARRRRRPGRRRVLRGRRSVPPGTRNLPPIPPCLRCAMRTVVSPATSSRPAKPPTAVWPIRWRRLVFRIRRGIIRIPRRLILSGRGSTPRKPRGIPNRRGRTRGAPS